MPLESSCGRGRASQGLSRSTEGKQIHGPGLLRDFLSFRRSLMKSSPKSSPRKQVKSRRKATAENEAKTSPGLFPIVGIGASAGGLEAFSELLRYLPEKTGMAFVLVQHLDPKHGSVLQEILARTTKIPVTEVIQGVVVQPDHAYVIPANTNLTLKNGMLQLGSRVLTRGSTCRSMIFFGRWRKTPGNRRSASSCRVRLRTAPRDAAPSRRRAESLLPRMRSRRNTTACRATR